MKTRYGFVLFDDETGPCWLRFRRRGGQLVAFQPSGKVVLVHENSLLKPDEPGHYFAGVIHDRGNVAFASLWKAHRTLKFSRAEAFGKTEDGETLLLRFRRPGCKKLPFVCDPESERLHLFGFDKCWLKYASGKTEFRAFRNGDWRVLKWHGPKKMTNDDYHKANQRVWEFVKGDRNLALGDPSEATVWSAALKAGVVTAEEEAEAARRSGDMWHYSGS